MSSFDRLEKLKELMDRNPGDSFPLYGVAMEYRRRGDLSEAACYFEKLVRDFPDDVAAYLQYGLTLLDLGREEEATEVLNSGIERSLASGNEHAAEEMRQLLETLA